MTAHTNTSNGKGQYEDTQFDVEIEEEFDSSRFEQGKSTESNQSNQPGTDPKEEARQRLLEAILILEDMVGDLATKAVVFSPPLITRQEVGIFGRNTINIIQGAFGSHKSRWAELMAALMLTSKPDDAQFLGFVRSILERFCLLYVDTERNLTEELPFAIQGIKTRAGFQLGDKPAHFRFTSVKAVERARRFDAIEAFISHVREQTDIHLFVVIDVVTDAIGDFNDPKESMKLFDFLGNLCDRHNATFLLVIHQNPGTDKARGHTGTEAANKASTVLQIGFEKTDKDEDSELIKLKYLKLRRGKRPEPVFLQYSEEANGLILASADAITNHINYRKHKAPVESMAERLEGLLSEGPLPKRDVVSTLMNEFSASNKTIRNRLDEITEQQPEMYDDEGRLVRLKGYRDGKNEYYKLEPIM